MTPRYFNLTLAAILWTAAPLSPLARESKKPLPASTAPTTFAPLPEGHALAPIWNDPDFARRLIGSYGFDSDLEPRLSPEEQAAYREKVLPLLREDPKKAIPLLESLAKPGASALFDFLLGNAEFQNEDTTNAVKHFEAAIAKFPDFRRAHMNLGKALVREGKYDQAIKPLARTVALGGADGKVFGLLGFAYLSQGRPASAAGAYQQALVFEPDNADFKLGAVKCAIASGNYDYALAFLDELVQQYPEREALWTLQANIYIQKEQTAQAAVSLEMLRRLGKAPPNSLFLLGDLYLAQEARELALAAYLEALEKDGGNNPARALRPAQILVSRGAWPEAKQIFAKIRASSAALATSDELKLLKLESKVAIATGAGAEAIQVLERIIQKNPLDGEALLMAGDYYAKHEEREKADLRFDTASKLTGFEADALVKRAQLLMQTQKYAQAADLLRKAQKVKPRDNVQRFLDRVEQLARTARL